MEIFRSTPVLTTKTCVAIGYFDGMHKGHIDVLSHAINAAKSSDLKSLLLTFDMSELRSSLKGYADLMSKDFKEETAQKLGFDYYCELPFSQIVSMTGEDFIEKILTNCLEASYVICGEDFKFGKNRTGDVTLLKKLSSFRGYTVIPIPQLCVNSHPISTSQIKSLISEGAVDTAANLLGYYYFIEGEVIHGNNLAHLLGFPTANISMNSSLVCPAKGVYLAKALLSGESEYRKAIVNIGTRPSVTEDILPSCEVHILNFSGNIYSTRLKVQLVRFLRPERRFADVEQLKDAVLSDIKLAEATDY